MKRALAITLSGMSLLGCYVDPCGGCHDAGPTPDAYRVPPPLEPFPTVDELPERTEIPALFESFDGTRTVETEEDWQGWRREELLELFSFYLYGYTPDRAIAVSATRLLSEPDFLPGVAAYEEHEITLAGLATRIHVSLFLPIGVESPPVFVAPNRCGNQEVSTDPRIRGTTAWFGEDCGDVLADTRGVRASQWPIEAITRAGFAFAAFHESELDPDGAGDDFGDGIHLELIDEARDPRLRWGRLAAWAWGVSRVVDFLVPSGLVDPSRIAVVGHSRRGKMALLAGARDPRIAMMIAHQSGTGGAALTHVDAPGSESVFAINTIFPTWFDDVYPTFADDETRLPIDQHMLIAMSAPRLVLVTDGAEDLRAEPTSAVQATELAEPAWALQGAAGIVREPDGTHGLEGNLAWRLRPGDHALTHDDWTTFLAFARAHWPAP
jgi:hypothetical protein